VLQNVNDLLVGNTVIKSPQKMSVIQQSSKCSPRKYKLVTPKSELIENVENTTILNRCKEDLSDEQKYIPSTSGSGMQIIKHIPHFDLNAHDHPSACMVALKFNTITIAR